MSAMQSEASSEEKVGERLRRLVDRTIQRNIKGVGYFASAAPPVGLTPKETIYKRGTLNLYHYMPLSDEIYRVPVLIVMATTNRAYVLDLAPGNSFVEFLLKAGYDVFVIDWDPPRPEESALRLEDYTQSFIPECIRRMQQVTGEDEFTLVGYCMGGVLSSIYTATHPDSAIKNLVCFTTPVNWHGMSLFAHWSNKKHFDVDRLVDSVGNIPADMLIASFDMLRPANKPAGRVRLWENMWNDEFVTAHRKFDRWANETLPLAGEYFRQTTKELMWDNKLNDGTLMVGGRSASLANVKVPLFHVVAEHDHIVPRKASEPLVRLAGSEDKTELVLKGGHISLLAGPNAVRRMWPQLDQWMAGRSI
jgi:polyhydroxyalkanoate synthase